MLGGKIMMQNRRVGGDGDGDVCGCGDAVVVMLWCLWCWLHELMVKEKLVGGGGSDDVVVLVMILYLGQG